MSQSISNGPSVIVSAASNRQQVPLRDYLNARVAPFLKKAITESLGAEAEFPLQWLGECLIHQSMLYEGNPDRKNIRERFSYSFEEPKAQEQASAEAAAVSIPHSEPDPAAAQSSAQEQQPDASLNNPSGHAAVQAPSASIHGDAVSQSSAAAEAPTVNGVTEDGGAHGADEAGDADTEMGGIS